MNAACKENIVVVKRNTALPELPRIVIVGGGAGGLELAVRLGNQLGKKCRAHITLIEAERTHLGKPLLHQIAAGTLDRLVSLGDASAVGTLMGAVARGSVFVEVKFARWMYCSLHKRHQVAINGWFYTILSTLAEWLNRASQPRIKLH
jgi:NADH dehydrogenase FAD-containing subunit